MKDGHRVFSIPGQSVRTCEGISRREWMRIGGLSSMGLGLSDLLKSKTAYGKPANIVDSVSEDSFGRAKHCIILFMFGAPAHQDTWDLKPDAPAEVRGEFNPVASKVPGITISEHLPLLSQMTDRFAQIRSVTHPDNTHTVAMHYMLTGRRHKRPKTNPQNAADDFPCFGAIMNHIQAKQSRAQNVLPPAISLNAPANQVSANNHIFPGFFAGFLGNSYDPLFVSQHPNDPKFQPLPQVENLNRLNARRELLSQFDQRSRYFNRVNAAANLGSYYDQAFQLLTSTAARNAFRLEDESKKLRERYGTTPFGQGCLLARRLIEADVSLVTLNWERDDAYWDTHADNFKKHKNQLLPNMDRGFSALLEDLQQRGLLDETLIVWLAEFGRTPKINKNAGRDHWAACNTVLLAGAGIPGGQVFGASDRQAAYPTLNPVGPEDLSATIYHLLGIDQHTLVKTAEGQPLPISTGEPIHAIL